ncbi:MAG: class I SAM-dependent methyltransferase [Nocardioidaceae bacterium]
MDDAREPTLAQRVAALGYDFAGQPKEHVPSCNLCGRRGRHIEVARRDRYGYPARCVVCGRCGLGYLSPRLTEEGYASFYAGVYRPLVSAYHGRRIDAETVQLDQRGYAADLVAFLAPLMPSPPRTILDVGGSTGVVARTVAEGLGGQHTVLDPSPRELALAGASGAEVIAGFAETFDPGERRWDLVLLCQTIDHLLDIRRTLLVLRSLTAAGGRAFVDVLDVELVMRRTGSIEGAVKIDHPFYLTGATAAAFFALAGYTVIGGRLTDDGHRGFMLAPGDLAEPNWSALEARASGFLGDIQALSPT